MIQGFNHITLSVRNLEESFLFYRDILGFKPLAKRKQKSVYFLAGSDWLALVEQKLVVSESYFHLAFSVEQKSFNPLVEKIKKCGAIIWQQNTSPGDSFYFLDPSGNKLEIHTGSWKSRIEWLKQNLAPGLEIFD